MKNREEKIMAWGEAKLLHHLRNFKRSKWAFKDYAYAFRMLRKFFKMHRTYDYDPVLMETYRKIVRKRYEEGGLCINYYRLFTRLSIYMDNVYHGRQINDLNPPASTQVNCGTYVWPEEPYTMRLGRFFNSILNRYRKHLERQMSAKKARNTEAKAHVFLSFLKANREDEQSCGQDHLGKLNSKNMTADASSPVAFYLLQCLTSEIVIFLKKLL